MRFPAAVTLGLALLVPVAVAAGTAGSGDERGDAPATRCVVAWARGETGEALAACREAAEAGVTDPRVLDVLARAELEAGDPARAEAVWRELERREGWRWPWAFGLARALWRQERTAEAEKILRDAVARDPSPGPRRELVRFLMAFSRWKDAATAAREAIERFPGDCTLHESLGVAEAGLGHDAEAARSIRKALELGCPPLRWTKEGEVPHRIERPEYRSLLDPAILARGLAALPEGEALHRLRLLELVAVSGIAPDLGDAALESSSAPVKLLAMHILLKLGDAAGPQWARILSSSDLMLRKHALRMLARRNDPALVPLLERRLREEKAPHNLSLVRIALARRIAAADPERARALLDAVPADDPSRPMAEALLAELDGDAGAGRGAPAD